ncbi:MAG: hypothetical protein ACOX3T_04525 [Bdellovibrionota bacterium]
MKRIFGVAVLACTIFFGATCFGQKENLVPKGGEKIEKVIPQDNAQNNAPNTNLTQEQLNYNHQTLIYAEMMEKDKATYSGESLYRRLGFLEKGITKFQSMVDEIQAIGVDANDIRVVNGCDSLKNSNLPVLIKNAAEIRSRMQEGVPKRRPARKQLEASLWNDPEILYIVAEIKFFCECSVRGWEITKKYSRKAADEIKEPIDKADKVLKQMEYICTGICMQFSEDSKAYWGNKLGMGKPKTVYYFKSVNGERKAYVMGKREGTDEIPEAVMPNDNRKNVNNRRRDQ